MPTDIFICPNPNDRAVLLNAIPRIFFPWEKLLPDLLRAGKQGFTVEFADLTAFSPPPDEEGHTHAEDEHGEGGHIMFGNKVPGLPNESAAAAWGLFWFDGRIQIENALRGQQDNIDWVLSAEIAHAVDVFYAAGKGMRAALGQLVSPLAPPAQPWFGGAYWDQPGESFMAGFGLAYTDFVTEDPRFRYRFEKNDAAAIRTVLAAPRTDQVAPPPPGPAIDWTLVNDDEFVKEYLNRFGDWMGIDISLIHRKGIRWARSWRD